MMQNIQLEDANFGSEQINNISEEGLTGLFALRRKEIEVIVIRTVEQLIGPILEPLIRRVVKEEIESAREKISTSRTRNPANEIHPPESRSLQLQFSTKISQTVMTGEQIKGEECDSIEVALVDILTGQVVTSGPLASAKVEMVVLKRDFDGEGQDWTVEEFNENVVRKLEENRILLNGKTCFNLKEGVGVLDEISFKHYSKWLKICEWRLGARVVDIPSGIRIREAKTERFSVTDRRNGLYKKHYPPSLDDEVWRLNNIRRDGPYHNRLRAESINTVKEFLREHTLNPKRLQDILRAGDKVWDVMVEHAQTCTLNKSRYSYCSPDSQPKTGVVFNTIGQVLGVLAESKYVPIDELSDTAKADAHKLVVSAYAHLNDIVSFVGEASIVEGSSCLPTDENCSNLPQSDIPCGNNFGSSLMTDSCDYAQPSTSYAGANVFGDHSFHVSEHERSLGLPVQVHNSSFCDPQSSTQALSSVDSFDIDLYLNTQSPNSVSLDDLQNGVVVPSFKNGKRNWLMLFTVMRLFSLKSIVLKSIPVTKRPRLC